LGTRADLVRKTWSAIAVILVAQASAAADPELQTIPVAGEEQSESIRTTDDPGGKVLDGIIVTPGKRPESIREIAGSVAAITGQLLEDIGARDQEDFLKLVPGVSLFKDEPNRNRITIRGIAADNGTSQAAGTLIDEVPFTDPFIADLSPDLSPFDLSRVEVMKGPQGTLFGASGLAGSIRYVPEPAHLDAWEIRGFGSYEAIRNGEREPTFGLAINAPIVKDSLALRLTGTQWNKPGVIDETGRGEADIDHAEQRSYRAQLRFAPGDRLEARVMHLKQKTSTDDLGFVDDRSGSLSRSSTPTASPVDSDFSLDSLTLSYDFGFATVTSASGRITKHLNLDADNSRATPSSRQFAQATVDGYTQELRLVSRDAPEDRWHWIVGGFFMHYDTFRRVDVFADVAGAIGLPLPPLPFIPLLPVIPGITQETGLVARFDLDATARELAAFGEISREFGTNFETTVGLRAYRTTSKGVARAAGPLNLAITGQLEARNDADLREQGVNPKASLKYRLGKDALIYALASRGFRFGGIQLIGATPTDDIPRTYKSDTLWLYESGLRTQWLQRTLTADVAVYQIDWKDPQLTQLTSSGLLLYINNVGASRVRGAELALRYLTPLPGLSIASTLAWTNARTTTPFTASSGTEVPAGSRWPFTSNRQIASDLTYSLALGDWRMTTSLVHTYTGRGFSNIENTAPIYEYWTLDAHARIGHVELPGKPEIAIGVTNLTDRRGVASDAVSGEVHTIYYVRPLMVTMQLALRF
jgi:iron complex outermembrane receptor protein